MQTTISISPQTLQQLRIKKVHNQDKTYDALLQRLLND